MTRVLFFVEDWPLSPDAKGGAGALNVSHLELVAGSGAAVHLVVLLRDGNGQQWRDGYTAAQPEMWARVQNWVDDVTFIPYVREGRGAAPLRHFVRALGDPLYLPSRFAARVTAALREVVQAAGVSVVWAEHFLPALIAVQAGLGVPIVYGHHDWLWRVKGYRHERGGLRGGIKARLQRRAEEALVRRVAAVVGGSRSELRTVEGLTPAETLYLPTSYEAVPLELDKMPNGPARVVHLGGMATTANRLGLGRFMDVVWPELVAEWGSPPPLQVVGSMTGASEGLVAQLEAAGAVMPGFVTDLQGELRPFDVHIIPWEHDTGTRTRIPLVMNYGQVIVAHRAGVAGSSELEDGVNAVLVDDLSAMAAAIAGLLGDDARRKRLGQAARATFDAHFTAAALQGRVTAFLQGVSSR